MMKEVIMLVFMLILCLSPVFLQGYETIWTSNFAQEENYGYTGNDLYLPTDEWNIDKQGISLEYTYFKVKNGLLEGKNFDCSYQLNDNNRGIIWQSKVISLNAELDYYCNFHFDTSDNWDIGNSSSTNDFVKIGYYDDNNQYQQIYYQCGSTERKIIGHQISNTSQCRLVVEVDNTSSSEIFSLYSVELYRETHLGDSRDLIISKLCSPEYENRQDRYIQITNVGNHLVSLSEYKLEALHSNRVIKTWFLDGFILPSQSLIIGDAETNSFFCHIASNSWTSHNSFWAGKPSYNDGAQIQQTNSRQITDKVVGINFENGFAQRDFSSLIASDETDTDAWSFQEIDSVEESSPGEFDFEQTLPVTFLNTSISLIDDSYIFNWTSQEEANLIGYNIYFNPIMDLNNAIKINSHIIFANNSVQQNTYSYNLTELSSSGFLWIEVNYVNQAFSYSEAVYFERISEDQDDNLLSSIPSNSINLYPNPSSSQTFLFIENKKWNIRKLRIYNIKGQVVGELNIKEKQDKYDLSKISRNLTSGIYFVQVEFDNLKISKKLILTK